MFGGGQETWRCFIIAVSETCINIFLCVRCFVVVRFKFQFVELCVVSKFCSFEILGEVRRSNGQIGRYKLITTVRSYRVSCSICYKNIDYQCRRLSCSYRRRMFELLKFKMLRRSNLLLFLAINEYRNNLTFLYSTN